MSKMQTAGGIVGALGLAGLLVVGAFSAQANHAPQPVPTVAAAITPYVPHVEGPAFDPRPTAAPVVVAAPAPVDVAPAPTGGWADGQAPAGTPIPTHLDTDPNSGSYGQYIIEDPALFCASHSGNDVGGTNVCA